MWPFPQDLDCDLTPPNALSWSLAQPRRTPASNLKIESFDASARIPRTASRRISHYFYINEESKAETDLQG
jgi:hypothetical protein